MKNFIQQNRFLSKRSRIAYACLYAQKAAGYSSVVGASQENGMNMTVSDEAARGRR